KQMSVQTIGHDKLNQLRHVRFYKNLDGIVAHMRKHADIIRPKFETVISAFERDFTDNRIMNWTNPRGGYFISVNLMDGCAKRTVQLCAEAGVVLTGAGATFPYGKDPHDSNIRIAPTYPSLEELSDAVEVFCLCVKLATLEKLLNT
ncbi:MAG: aminotransferase, partial [Clostridia bacterium]|nr:aminotransferase [Clostridia bacterium]